MEHFLSIDILINIGEYLNNVEDYIHLFQINKFVYKNILNNFNAVLRNEIFKKDVIIYLNKRLPNYLFQLQYLNIILGNEINFTFFDKFKYLKYLEIQSLPENFIFPNLQLLEELIIKKSNLQKFTLINLQQQLTSLDLQNCFVKDEDISYFINLKKLNALQCDELTGECLQNFTNLVDLSIELKDINEIDFYNLKQLKKLQIKGNILYENCFTDLVNLTELDVTNCNNFNGKCLLNLINLEKLNVYGTIVKDEYLKNLINLKEVDLSYCNKITGECLLSFINLEYLTLKKNLSLRDDEYFKNLNNLKTLNISDCHDLKGKFLQYLTKLQKFYFESLSISEEYLKMLTNLNYLSFSQYLDNIVGEFFLNLTNLKTLCIKTTFINNVKDEHLINLKQLNTLNLFYCESVVGTCFLNLENLTTLNLFYSSNVVDNYFQNLIHLQKLKLYYCENITGKCFNYLTNLKDLSLENCKNVKAEFLEQLKNIFIIKISNCPQLCKKGKYLLNMENLNGLELNDLKFKTSGINLLKERIKKGKTLEQLLQSN
ncbi:hypothetical protein ABK040_001382 [Willaertia magna]